MKDAPVSPLLRDIAAGAIVDAIRPRPPAWDEDPSFSLEKLPIDETPWFGGVVQVRIPVPGQRGWTKAPFLFWTANEQMVWIGTMFHGCGPSEFAFSLMDAMVAPMFDDARRPAKLFVQNDAMATALRASSGDVGHDIGALVDIAVKRAPDDEAQVVAFLHFQAEQLAQRGTR